MDHGLFSRAGTRAFPRKSHVSRLPTFIRICFTRTTAVLDVWLNIRDLQEYKESMETPMIKRLCLEPCRVPISYLPGHMNCLAVSSPSVDFSNGLSTQNVASASFAGCPLLVEWIYPEGFGSGNCYVTRNPGNELSLSLAMSKHSGIGSASVIVQSSNKDLLLCASSSSLGQLPPFTAGSKYLVVVQEILAQVTTYSLENLDSVTFPSKFRDHGGRPDALSLAAREVRKSYLLALLHIVDDRYNHCLDEIHTVITTFHMATELDPKIHTRFALQTISILYRSILQRISGYMLLMGEDFSLATSWPEESFDASFIQRQLTLQQLKRKDNQLWRPQRGLL